MRFKDHVCHVYINGELETVVEYFYGSLLGNLKKLNPGIPVNVLVDMANSYVDELIKTERKHVIGEDVYQIFSRPTRVISKVIVLNGSIHLDLDSPKDPCEECPQRWDPYWEDNHPCNKCFYYKGE